MDKKFEEKVIQLSSIPLEGGGDTHIHVYGPQASDFVVTTRLPSPIKGVEGLDFHDKIDMSDK